MKMFARLSVLSICLGLLPASPAIPGNDLSIGFAGAVVGGCVAYVMGIRAACCG